MFLNPSKKKIDYPKINILLDCESDQDGSKLIKNIPLTKRYMQMIRGMSSIETCSMGSLMKIRFFDCNGHEINGNDLLEMYNEFNKE